MSELDLVKIKKYKKEDAYSYTMGAFPTFELIKHHADKVICILLHSKLKITEDIQKLQEKCKELHITIKVDDRAIERLADKENCFVIGIFNKYESEKQVGRHIVLVNPSDMGNMGTIMRTMHGFGIDNLAIVKPAVDIFNPKVIRASMGAIFGLKIEEYDCVEDYLKSNNNKKYFFMLKGKHKLGHFEIAKTDFDLVFGNEATGLPEFLLNYDESVVIEHTKNIDSLNLPISVGMAIYEANRQTKEN